MTSPEERPRSTLPPVQYRGEPLEAERGPGLGCFRFQVVVLAVLVVLTPLSASFGWPEWLSAVLLFVTIGLLLLTGQTIIFLLRLLAAERREGRRRPMATARSRTVGEIDDDAATARDDAATARDDAAIARDEDGPPPPPVRE